MAKKRFTEDLFGLFEDPNDPGAEQQGDAVPPLILRIDPAIERGKLICQLGTGEPELALAAALHVHKDVDAIDVNM